MKMPSLCFSLLRQTVFALLASFLVFPLVAVQGAEPKVDVVVVVDMTPEGRQVARPTPEHPIYYWPLIAGLREEGSVVAGDNKVQRDALLALFNAALFKQGYRFVADPKVTPSLLLVLEWGSINPDPTGQEIYMQGTFSQRQMLALVGGDALRDFDKMSVEEKNALLFDANDDRYFIIVSAFDFAAARGHEKRLLWRAKLSTPRDRTSLPDAARALVNAGAPFFGRETTRPVHVDRALASQGIVNFGPLEVKEYTPASVPPPASSSAREP